MRRQLFCLVKYTGFVLLAEMFLSLIIDTLRILICGLKSMDICMLFRILLLTAVSSRGRGSPYKFVRRERHTHTHTHTHTRTRTSTRTQARARAHVHTHEHTHPPTHTHARTHTRTQQELTLPSLLYRPN